MRRRPRICRKNKLFEQRFLVAIPAATIAAVAPATAETTAATTTATAATTESAATAATAPESTAATTPASATTALFARSGFIDGEGAATMFLAIKTSDCGLSFLIGRHLDEPKSLAAAGVPVVDDLGRYHLPVRGEQLLELGTGDVVAQVPDV